MTVYRCNKTRCAEGFCIGKPGGLCEHTTDIEFAQNKTGPWTFKVTEDGKLVEVTRKESTS